MTDKNNTLQDVEALKKDAERLDFLSKQIRQWHTGDGGISARLKFGWEDSILKTSFRDAIDAAIRQESACQNIKPR